MLPLFDATIHVLPIVNFALLVCLLVTVRNYIRGRLQ